MLHRLEPAVKHFKNIFLQTLARDQDALGSWYENKQGARRTSERLDPYPMRSSSNNQHSFPGNTRSELFSSLRFLEPHSQAGMSITLTTKWPNG